MKLELEPGELKHILDCWIRSVERPDQVERYREFLGVVKDLIPPAVDLLKPMLQPFNGTRRELAEAETKPPQVSEPPDPT